MDRDKRKEAMEKVESEISEGTRSEMIERYKAYDFKLTPQRMAILEYLEGNKNHPTAEDIYEAVRKRYPGISFATVYNTAQLLVGFGELSEVSIDRERTHFDPDTRTHHHVICKRCKKIVDVFEDYSMELKLPEAVLEDFKIEDTDVNFTGICKDCMG